MKCHGGDKVKGKVNLKEIGNARQFLGKPALIKELIDVLDAGDMPPEDEPQLKPADRAELLTTLKAMLRTAASGQAAKRNPPRRLNRFQYNNAVRDLFQLNRNVFALSEKLMTRETIYLNAPKMPDRVNARSHALNPSGGLTEVKPFPQDLRASHGFDNQANQLTLSPLLLDAFFRLSVSIIDSPDFNENTVGIWNTFSSPRRGPDLPRNAPAHCRVPATRLPRPGGAGHARTLHRLRAWQMKQELSFTDTMKKVASAALSSPLFLYHYQSTDPKQRSFALASNLSFFLWASTPDAELLQLAERGELAKPEVMEKTIDRMLADPKVERFLDSFPSQWMQLENILAATPDPKQHRYFSLDKQNPASLQMLIEPLLLFDSVFVENRPITELVLPEYSYRSDFLKDWYTSDLKPTLPDVSDMVTANREIDERKRGLEELIKTTEADLAKLIEPVRERLLAERKKNSTNQKPVNLKPYAAWEFNGDLKSTVGNLPLKSSGNVTFKDGQVVLNRGFLESPKLPISLKAKTLEVWFSIPNLDQRGGGVMGTQGPGDFFDTIVLGERQNRHWISGSNGFARTLDFPDSTPETAVNQLIHLAMVYLRTAPPCSIATEYPTANPSAATALPSPRIKPPSSSASATTGRRQQVSECLHRQGAPVQPPAQRRGSRRLRVRQQSVHHRDRRPAGDECRSEETTRRSQPDPQAGAGHPAKIAAQKDVGKVQQNARQQFDNVMRKKLRGNTFTRMPVENPRYGGIITSAAMLSMNNGTKRTHPIARGAWIIEVIFRSPATTAQ